MNSSRRRKTIWLLGLLVFAGMFAVVGKRGWILRFYHSEAEAPGHSAGNAPIFRPLPKAFTAGPSSVEDFPFWLHGLVEDLKWDEHPGYRPALTRKTLEKSLELGQRYLLNNQKAAGNFNYSYDCVTRKLANEDNAARQAGALWGLALVYRHHPEERTRQALDRGIDFFLSQGKATGVGQARIIAYPGEIECNSTTVALTALALIDYLRVGKEGQVTFTKERQENLEAALEALLRHLEFMRLPNKHFADSWSLKKKIKGLTWNPYCDGEVLLCYISAAKYLGVSWLMPLIEDSILDMAKSYTADQWRANPDSDLTKGFFQWSCLALWEYRDTGWKQAGVADDYLVALSWWMLHVHQVLARTRNTGYAFEGLIPGYAAATERGNVAARNDLGWAIDQGLAKLTSWQVGGPMREQNPFLKALPMQDALALGGVLNARDEGELRIDVTQHQVHAVLLALQYIYTNR
jgi:UDP-N-acetylmuramoyl-tripeptide--D-alanyl-D-alanine ligase